MKSNGDSTIVEALIFWVSILLLVFLLLAGCAGNRNVQRDTRTDYTECFEGMQVRLDSLLAGMKLQCAVTTEKLSNLKIENRTVYLSVPDTMGAQYPTVISETKAENRTEVSTDTNIELQASVEKLLAEVAEMRSEIKSNNKVSEHIETASWLESHKYNILFVVALSVIVVWLVKKRDYG